ncbi:MAG: HypC/HybG/HupF family hydrogenase formation chaperone [Candidatus Micrarchaeota archaeon]
MCYAIPARILKVEGDNATVDYGGVRKKANISLMDEVAVGDYILIHAGFAIEKLEKKSAEESLQLIREYIAETEKG